MEPVSRHHRIRRFIADLAVAALALAGGCGEAPPPPPSPENLASFDPEVAKAFETCLAQVRQAPRDAEPWRQLGLAYLANEQYPMAVQCLEQATTLDNRDPRARYQLALARHELGDLTAALADGEQAAQLADRYAPAHWRLGLWKLDQGDVAGAKKPLEQAIRINPQDPIAWLGLGMVYLDQDQAEKAVEAIKKSQERSGTAMHVRASALAQLARAYRQLGRMEEAEQAARAAGAAGHAAGGFSDEWQLEPVKYLLAFGARLRLSDQLIDAGQLNEAETMLRQLQQRQPENAAAIRKLAGLALRRGDMTSGIELLEASLQRDDNDAMTHLQLGQALARQAMAAPIEIRDATLQRALAEADRAIQLNSALAPAYGFRGDLLLLSGQHDAAMTSWKQAAGLEGRNPLWRFQIGKLSVQLGRWQDAVALLESVLRDVPGHIEAMTLLAVAHTRLGRLDEAEQLLNQARQLKPDDRQVMQAMLDLEAARNGAAPIGPSDVPGVGGG